MKRSSVLAILTPLLLGCENVEQTPYFPDFPAGSVTVYDAHPAVSHSGDWVAFKRLTPSSESEAVGVYLIRPDGSDEHLLLPNTETPSWSPTDSSLLVVSVDEGHIWSFDLASSAAWKVATGSRQYLAPTWNANGDSILFATRIGFEDERGLWLLNPNTGSYSHLLVAFSSYARFSSGPHRIVYLDDGRRIAAIEADTGITVQIITASELQQSSLRWPSADSTGSRLLFYSLPEGDGNYQVWLHELDSGQTSVLIDGAAYPAWSPDGHQVFYTKWDRLNVDGIGNGRIWKLDLNSGIRRQVTGLLEGNR